MKDYGFITSAPATNSLRWFLRNRNSSWLFFYCFMVHLRTPAATSEPWLIINGCDIKSPVSWSVTLMTRWFESLAVSCSSVVSFLFKTFMNPEKINLNVGDIQFISDWHHISCWLYFILTQSHITVLLPQILNHLRSQSLETVWRSTFITNMSGDWKNHLSIKLLQKPVDKVKSSF